MQTENKIVNTITEKNGVYTLRRNGQPACCHIQPGLDRKFIEGKKQKFTFQFHGCTSLCPHFQIENGNVNLGCGSGKTSLEITTPKTDLKKA